MAGGLMAAAVAAAPGELDPTFSGDGRVTLERGTDSTAMVVRRDGGVILAGCAGRRDPRVLARVSPAGAFLGRFGSAPGFGCAADARLTRGGKILLAGYGPAGGCVVARLDGQGNLDRSFSGNGLKPIRFAGGRSFGFCPALASGRGGRVVVLGTDGRGPAGAYHFAVARLRPNGAFDRSFSDDGRTVGRFRRGGRTADPRDVAIQPDGKIVVVGKAGTFAIARLTERGRPDRSFSFDGRRLIARGAIGGANAVTVDANDRLVLVGEMFEGNSERFRRLAVFRLTRRGDLDYAFGDVGAFLGHVGADVVHDTGAAVAIDDDGRILVAGATQVSGASATPDFGLVRLTPQGAADDSFSGDGRVAIGFEGLSGPDGADFAERVATLPDGRIVVVGDSEPGLSIARVLGG
ncbi:MAG TPA: hypothetical protein VKA89_08520 [Solirubrobacterales bacterium]|nr:hypothetical protein [Solirubrobacterales bacterium]